MEQLIRRGADAAARLAAATQADDEAQKGTFHMLKLVRQLLKADKRCALSATPPPCTRLHSPSVAREHVIGWFSKGFCEVQQFNAPLEPQVT